MNESQEYIEVQRFNQKWLWISIAILFIIPICIAIFYNQGIFISLLICIPIIVLLLITRLRTIINQDGVSVKFFPFFVFDKLISWDQIDSIYLKKYNPIRDFGGWGVRISHKNGMAYNIKGNLGIQINFKNGNKLLIGTQNPQEVQYFLNIFLKQ